MAKYRVETDNGTYEVETDDTSTQPTEPGLLQKAGEALSTPFRGTRALGVGAQHLIQKAIPGGENMPLGDILQRSAEAVQPGFEAKPGERIGSAIGVSGPALPLAALAGLPGVAATAGVAALGKGSESLAEGKSAAEAGKAAAIEGGLNLVLPAVAYGGTRLLKAAYRPLAGALKGVSRKVVDTVFDAAKDMPETVSAAATDFFESIGKAQKTALSHLNIAGSGGEAALKAAKAVPEVAVDFAETAHKAARFSEELGSSAMEMVDQAVSKLKHTPSIDGLKLSSMADNLRRQLDTQTLGAGQATAVAKRALSRWDQTLRKLGQTEVKEMNLATMQEVPQVKSKLVSELELRKLIKALDEDINFEGIANTPAERVLRSLRGQLDDVLKKANPEYAKAISGASEKLTAKTAFDKALALDHSQKRGVTMATDQTVARLESFAKSKKPISSAVPEATGFSPLESLKQGVEQNTAREAGIKSASDTLESSLSQAEKGLVSSPNLSEIRQLAESASKTGLDSPAGERLLELLRPVFGPDAENQAQKLLVSGAKELFSRGRGASKLADVLGPSAGGLRKLNALGVRGGQAVKRASKASSPLIRGITEDQKRKEK